MIRAAVGISKNSDGARAAIEAGAEALEGLEAPEADWCVAFVTQDHENQLPGLLETISGRTGTPYVVGCSASGILSATTEIEGGSAVGVLAVGSDQLRATPFLFHDEGDQGLTAGVRLGQRFVASRDAEDLFLVWPDPYHVRPDRLIRGIDGVLGRVPVVGGAASGNGPNGRTFQFCGAETGHAAVSGMRLSGRFRHVIGVTQGCRPLGSPQRITRSHENLVLEIEDLPAFEALREQAPGDLLADLDWGLNYLGVGLVPERPGVRVDFGEYLVRNIVTADPDTGVLAVAGAVEEGQSVVFVQREAAAAKADLERMLAEVSPKRTGLDYRFGLYFNCVARGRSLYGESGIDASRLARALPGVPLLGFFSNAEIGPMHGHNHLFTYTGVLLLVAG